MSQPLGPWSITFGDNCGAQLSMFWRSRLSRLADVAGSRTTVPRGQLSVFCVVALAVLVVPLFQTSVPAGTSAIQKKARASKKPGRIVFWRNNRLASVRPNGLGLKWLTKEPRDQSFDNPRISPSGQILVFGVRNRGADEIIHGDSPASLHVKELGDREQSRNLQVNCHFWCWSPDGKQLAVSRIEPAGDDSFAATHSLVDVASATTQSLNLPDDQFLNDWSADGKWFLTTGVVPPDIREGRRKPIGQVFRVNRDGTAVVPVPVPPQGAGFGRFSPDRKRILYLVGHKVDGSFDTSSLWIVGIEKGAMPRQVTPGLNEEVMGFCWSPDGKEIVYAWRQAHQEETTESFLDIISVDGKPVRTLIHEKVNRGTFTAFSLASPDWR